MGNYISGRYDLVAPDDNDPFSDVGLRMRNLVDQLDFMLGETGTTNITPSAVNTDTQIRVNYSRSYASLAPLVPFPTAHLNDDVPSTHTTYVRTLGADATGFTLAIRSSHTTTRTVRWRATPQP